MMANQKFIQEIDMLCNGPFGSRSDRTSYMPGDGTDPPSSGDMTWGGLSAPSAFVGGGLWDPPLVFDVECYFEVYATNDDSVSRYIRVYANSKVIAQIDIPGNTSTKTRFREIFTDRDRYGWTLYIEQTGSEGDVQIYTAKVIIARDLATPSIMTCHYFQIGNWAEGLFSAAPDTFVPLPEERRWKYDPDDWDENGSLWGVATMSIAAINTMYAVDTRLEEDDGALGSWSNKVSIHADYSSLAVSSRYVFFELVPGRTYRFAIATDEDKAARGMFTWSAMIVVVQFPAIAHNFNYSMSSWVEVYGGTGTQEAILQSFKAIRTAACPWIRLSCRDQGSPSDAIYCEIATSEIGGTIATSDNIDAPISDVTHIKFTFPSPPTLTEDTTYYFRILRTGARSTTNCYYFSCPSTVPYVDGVCKHRDSGSWISYSNDLHFIVGSDDEITKWEDDMTLIRDGVSSTGEVDEPVYFDPAQFDEDESIFIHEITCDDDATNVKIRDSNPTDLAGSDILGIESALDPQESDSVYPCVLDLTPSSSTVLDGTPEGVSNSFIADGGKLEGVKVFIGKNNTPTGTAYIRLYAIDGSDLPTGSVLAEIEFTESDISATDGWHQFWFNTPYQTVAATTYAITVEHAAGDGTNNFEVYYGSGRGQGGTYNGASCSTDTNEYAFMPQEGIVMPTSADTIKAYVVAT